MAHTDEPHYLDALDDVFLVLDGTGRIETYNSAAEDVTGYAGDELADASIADVFTDGDPVLAGVSEALEAGERTVETALETAGGTTIPYEVTVRRLPEGTDGAVAAIGRDITERYRIRARSEVREQVLREMYEVISDRERSFAEQVEALLALGRAELETDYGSLSRIEGEEYVFEYVDGVDDAVEQGDVAPLSATNCEIAATTEETLVLGDVARDAPEETDRAGYTEWGISCYIGAPVIVDGDVYGTFCFYGTSPGEFSDWEETLVDLMSSWVSYELKRQEVNDRLQQQNDRLERFASIVSHDLRNPLHVADGAIELAAETGDLSELERAERALDRMATLIDDLLTLSQSGTTIGDTQAIDLASLGRHCWDSVPTSAAELVVETDRTVQADRTRLKQLLENLFRNSVEHGSTGNRAQPGDSVEHGSTSSRPQADDSVEHGSTSPDSRTRQDAVEHGAPRDQIGADGGEADDEGVTVTLGDGPDGFFVADDGTGIPEDEREQVFESGYSTTDDGTGFGLAIVSEIAAAHGWDVTVTESAAGGARFEFET